MSSVAERRPFWKWHIGEGLLWLLPALLAVLGHLEALPKATLSDSGPGFHILLMNERTAQAQELWEFLSNAWWLFVLYACLMLGVYIVLRVKRVSMWVRIPAMGLMAVPGVWYSLEMSYLAGKVIGL